MRHRSSWRVRQKRQGGFLAVDILRESVGTVYLGRTILQKWRGRELRLSPKDGSVRPRESPAGASQHAHEVVLGRRSLPHGPRDDQAGHTRRKSKQHTGATCLTKHSLSFVRSLSRSRYDEDEWAPHAGLTERCAQNTGYSSAGIFREKERTRGQNGRMPPCSWYYQSLPMYKSQPIYSIQLDTRLTTTLGRAR